MKASSDNKVRLKQHPRVMKHFTFTFSQCSISDIEVTGNFNVHVLKRKNTLISILQFPSPSLSHESDGGGNYIYCSRTLKMEADGDGNYRYISKY